MKESVAIAKEADRKKESSPTRSNNSIQRLRNEPERQLGSLRDVIGNIQRNGGTPSVESIATELSSMHTAQRASALLALQQTHGNRYVQRVVTGIQAKLKVGQQGDIYEQEADRVAEQVMRMPDLKNDDSNKYLQATFCVQRRVPDTQNGATKVPSIVHDELYTAGQPLDLATRGFMEPLFDHDFSQVRIHTGSKAQESANAVRAKAYTIGKDVVFGAGQYAPGTTAGKLLLAHELTHVVQQSRDSKVAGVIQRVGECRGRNGYDCNGVRCTTAAGRPGLCTWGGIRYGCNCRDTSTDAPGPSGVREMLPTWLLLLLSAAAIAAIVACFASGVCEFGLVVAGLGAAAAAAVIAILNADGIRDSGSSGGEVA
jgi:hypothetical protein